MGLWLAPAGRAGPQTSPDAPPGPVASQPQSTASQVALAAAYASDDNWPAVRKVLSPLEDKLDAAGLVLLADAHAETEHPVRASRILRRGLERHPETEALWLAWIDLALRQDLCGQALERVRKAEGKLGPSAQLHFRAAQARFRLGQALGQTRLIHVPGGRAGQFVNDWLLIEERGEPAHFLCCPKASSLYALRQALDRGLDEPAAHCLHARIWQRAGRPEVGLAILQSREALWREDAPLETLATLADLALAANALDDFLRYARRRAARQPQQRAKILYDAFLAVAERYNQRGDETMYREFLRRALALNSADTELMRQLADTVWDAGDRDEAAVWYRRVLEREPAHRDRKRILKRLEE